MHKDSGCFIGKHEKPFDMPHNIVEKTLEGNLAIFAGAGVSTENKIVFPNTLYEEVCDEIKIDYDKSFSVVMSLYCEKFSRKKLLHKIKNRFDYIFAFNQLYNFASRFHRELSTIHQIKDIFTTNWDDLFERECGAIPIVTSKDFVFWDFPERKVFKLHGSINNIGTIIATKDDYENCYDKLSNKLIGNYLKMALATKCILFVGYSFRDEDFNKIYNLLKKEMGELLPKAYLVTLDDEAKQKFKDTNIEPIITDATYFIKKLKQIIINKEKMLKDEILEEASYLLYTVTNLHQELANKYTVKDHPSLLYTLTYQDGLIQALQRINNRKNTGEYSNKKNICTIIDKYEQLQKNKMQQELYSDVSYIEGYLNGLRFIINKDLRNPDYRIPIYFIFGRDELGKFNKEPLNYNEFKKIIEEDNILDKQAYKYAIEYLDKLDDNEKNLVVHHTPFL